MRECAKNANNQHTSVTVSLQPNSENSVKTKNKGETLISGKSGSTLEDWEDVE